MGIGALFLLLFGLFDSAAEPVPAPKPGPKPPMPKPPEPPPGPDMGACFRVRLLGRSYQWTRAELEQMVKGTAFDNPALRAELDALAMGESFEHAGATVTRVECDVLDIEPGPPPEPAPGSEALWPLPGVSSKGKPKWGGKFGAPRGGAKLHAGVDLGAPEGTPVVAPEDGKLVRAQGWDGPNAKALLMETARPGGPVLLFGAVAPESWPVDKNGKLIQRDVKRGEQIATIGIYPGGVPGKSTMLHFEMYKRGTRSNRKYYSNKPRPSALLDPTDYVKAMVHA